jgi:hypothetical protein
MISITRQPKEIDFCGNDLRFIVNSSSAYSAYGSFAELTINVNAILVTGNEFTFAFGQRIIKFTTVTLPDNSGCSFLSGSGVIEITEILKKNYLLQKHYNITRLANSITLIPKQSGAYYSLTFYANNANISLYSNTPGSDKTLRLAYKTLCEIYLEKDRATNIFELLATSMHNVDVNGSCNILPGLLLSKYYTDSDLPDYNQTSIKKVNKIAKRFFLKLAEMYEGSVKSVLTTSMFYAVDGKINNALFTNSFDFITEATAKKCYLLDPSVLKIETWIDAQQFLYFVNYLTTTNFSQKVKIYYTDGSDVTLIKEVITGSVKGECFIIPCGFTQLNLQTVNPLKNVFKYDVYLENGGVLVGKVITYYLMPKPLFSREFLFKNSMGGIETLLCEKQIHKLNIKRSELISDSGYSTDIDEINDSYECITGYKTMKEIEHLAEFICSKSTYLLYNTSICEVAIEQGDYTLSDENEDLYNFKFKYRIKTTKSIEIIPPKIITAGNSSLGINTAAKKIVVGF